MMLAQLAKTLLMSPRDLATLCMTAPRRYKVYQIRKKSGEFRTIAQPAREVKRVQRHLVTNYLLPIIPVHKAATAYKKGASIRDNAERHAANSFMLKMDFADFFPSIQQMDVINFLRASFPDQPFEDIAAIANLFLWRPKGEAVLRLSIGAPSSPFISNAILYPFDQEIEEFCRGREVVYTRYADDLTFSTNSRDVLVLVEGKVKSCVERMGSPRLSVKEKKTIYISKKFQRRVTGLIVTNDGNISIGRDLKRLVRARMHHYVSGALSTDEALELRGMLAFIKSSEPEFLQRLRDKYGGEYVQRLFSIPVQKPNRTLLRKRPLALGG